MKNQKNKIFGSIIAVVLLIGIVFIINDNRKASHVHSSANELRQNNQILVNDTTNEPSSHTNDIIRYHGDLANNYNTVTELTYDSEAIYKVEVINSKSFEYEGVVFTVSTANVVENYKGDVISSFVNILETGGNYNNTEYVFEDSSVLKSGDKAVVYLKKYEGPIPEAQGAFVISGVYQGKFNIDEASGDLLVPAAVEQQELTEVRSLIDLNLE
ncbi:hypothetical protein [Paenibacillus tepidiphilus]|uniref:hypothetical protein n=1 Tax=Paenibacillus tepidiphilus TaxID=2608683 RepID=UPI00123BAC42|nr:hypothetical protein [Paenibacillus tepidiphilus]